MSENNECTHDCSSCGADCPSKGGGAIEKEKLNPASEVRHVIGVVSGKGGVGKSIVTSMLAVEMRRRDFGVAVLDADITGPSAPKAFGAGADAGVEVRDEVMLPYMTKTGIQLMSVNLLLGDESKPRSMARTGHCGRRKAVLDGCYLERRRLYVCRYASRNGRRSADGVPVSAP